VIGNLFTFASSTGVTLSNESIESVAMPALLLVVLILAGQKAKNRGGR